MARSPAAPFWARGSPRRLPGGSRAPASCTKSPGPPGQPARRQACPGRPISCWTGWSCWSPWVAPKRYTLAGPGSAGLCRRRDHQRGAAAVVGTGRDGGEHGVGRRALARDRGPPCPVLTRGGLAGPAGAFGEWDGDYHGLAWRFRGGCFAGRGGGGDRGRDRDPVRPLRGRVARRIRGVQAEAAPLIEAVTTDARTGARAEASNGRSGYLPSCTTDSAATTGPGPGAAGPASRRLSCTPPWGHWLS